MDTNKILNADVLDIIFDGKNKNYGAYALRKSYNKRLVKALAVTGLVALLFFFSSVFANIIGKNKNEAIDVVDTRMAELKKDPPPPVMPPPPPPQATPPPPLNQVRFTPPVIVKDDDVKPDEKIEEIKDNQAISTVTKETDNTNQVVQAPLEESNSGAFEAPKKNEDDTKVFLKVEKEAAFDGDWVNFLKRNLNADVPNDNGAPEGVYTVVVKFIVSKDGSLSDITCESDPGYGICKEAIRVIKKTKNWIPALQNGNNVNAYRRQPITFQVQGL
ncbi:energy transducer TonB [Ferruginibacter sp. SUN106]|uniref:energy transducer TonB n=1 Tax=Ferruginibacter sp. SUN106 TaxID=2978348 RepID=UPI003D363BAB